MKRSLHQGGFTLLEIMLVVAIIAILVGSAIVVDNTAISLTDAHFDPKLSAFARPT